MFESVHSVMFFVSDVAKACAWYSKFLDCEPTYLAPDFPVLRAASVEICFHLADSKVSSGHAGAVTYFRVNNLAVAISRAEYLGGSVYRGPLEIENGDSICQIADPFGNLLGMVGKLASAS